MNVISLSELLLVYFTGIAANFSEATLVDMDQICHTITKYNNRWTIRSFKIVWNIYGSDGYVTPEL